MGASGSRRANCKLYSRRVVWEDFLLEGNDTGRSITWANCQTGQSGARAESRSRKRPAREILGQGNMDNGVLPLVPGAVSQLLEKRRKTLKAEMKTVLAATIQPVVSQVSGLAGALIKADQTAMAVTRNHEMFEAITARPPDAPASS